MEKRARNTNNNLRKQQQGKKDKRDKKETKTKEVKDKMEPLELIIPLLWFSNSQDCAKTIITLVRFPGWLES